jgi:glutathione S-transferase
VPADDAGIARVLENWGHEGLEERVRRAVVTRVSPTFRDAEERWVFEELQTRSRGPLEALEARRPEFVGELMPYFLLVDEMVADRRIGILDRPSVAYLGICGGLSPWFTVGERIPPTLRHLARWVGRVARPKAPAAPRVRPERSRAHRSERERPRGPFAGLAGTVPVYSRTVNRAPGALKPAFT